MNTHLELIGQERCFFTGVSKLGLVPRKPEGRVRVFEATLRVFAGKFSQSLCRKNFKRLETVRLWLNPQKRSGAKKPGPGRRASFLTNFQAI